jgi:hypothetical protein
VLLYVFEVLPYLHEQGLFPDWDIRAKLYGAPPDNRVIPGVLDLAYTVETGAKRRVSLAQIRQRHCRVLGSDFAALGRIWDDYFRIPERVLRAAEAVGDLSRSLGVHYRGNDKNTTTWDTNPVSHDDYLTIILDFLAQRPNIDQIFLATDEGPFFEFLRKRSPVPVINLGEVGFHKDDHTGSGSDARADRAVLDCVLLSRCAVTLQNSSALSGFAKVLNPELEIYRCAASKRFADIPYFPVAYIPKIEPRSEDARRVVERLMADDWTVTEGAEPFRARFTSRLRYGFRDRLWGGIEAVTGLRVASSIKWPRRRG